jgi:succinate dehydrogenase/fumarate reductase flavoprotein subunit
MDDPCAWLDMLEDDFKDEVDRGDDPRLAICDTLEEVADFIGAEPEVLKKSVEDYNRFCEIQYDCDFLKPAEYLWPLTTPPYYIFKGFQGIDTCIGGILIDHNMRVLNEQHRPIKYLYAAAVCTSGWANNGYAFMGTCLGSSLFGGYSAGKLAAEEAMKRCHNCYSRSLQVDQRPRLRLSPTLLSHSCLDRIIRILASVAPAMILGTRRPVPPMPVSPGWFYPIT